MKSAQKPDRFLTEITAGIKTILVMGPGVVVLVAVGLAIAGACFFPLLGASAWDPLLSLIDPELLAQHIAITYTLATLLLVLGVLKQQRRTRWRSSKLPEFLITKGRHLWIGIPKHQASEHLVQIPAGQPVDTTADHHSETEQFLICATGLSSVRRGLQ